ncbi:MAG: Gfo/Idh/MocA family oxidoreductase [Acidobacteriota bacterium]|nr:Gfo/Idh/MocA family oxidoreductase [Acidobacteriota bacterium]
MAAFAPASEARRRVRDGAAVIRPLVVGSGTAGRALGTALGMFPEDIEPPVRLERSAPLPEPESPERDLLVLANPHALHTPRLLEAAERGYRYSICEKPAAVDLRQVATLDGLSVETWICHGYRLLWGPRELERVIRQGRFGRLLSIEGRYWQSSATRPGGGHSWKDDSSLAGEYDVLLDLATHWADLMAFLAGSVSDETTAEIADKTRVRRWFVNSASEHRDTHAHVEMVFGDLLTLGSVSKTVHGAGNHLELHVIGQKASASWSLSEPDRIVWGDREGYSTRQRTAAVAPFRPPPFHGLGWMEGYARLVHEVVGRIRHDRSCEAPTLAEHLGVLRCLLGAVE